MFKNKELDEKRLTDIERLNRTVSNLRTKVDWMEKSIENLYENRDKKFLELLDFLGLEIHKPDCKPVIRKKEV